MKLRKHGLRAIGLSLIAALSLMAFTAVSAQAAGEWKIGGKTMSELKLTEETVTGKVEPELPLKLLIKALNIYLTCPTIHVNGVLLVGPVASVHGTTTFLTCTVRSISPDEELKACGVKSTGQAAGVIATAKINGEVILSGAENVVLFKPSSGTTFTTVEITGASCAVKGTYPITGTSVFKLGAEAKELLILSIEFAGDGLKFGESKAILDGSALAELTGAKKGSAWTGF